MFARRNHCNECPIQAGGYCRGENVPYYCDRLNPTHSEYNPKYRDVVIQSSQAWTIYLKRQAYPPLATQAANLFRSAIGFARSGFKLAPRAVRRERLAICQACEKYDPVQKRCTVCGCKNKA